MEVKAEVKGLRLCKDMKVHDVCVNETTTAQAFLCCAHYTCIFGPW